MRLSAICLFMMASALYADTPADPYARITANEKGTVFFKMVPAKTHFEADKMMTDHEPYGIAYRVHDEGEMIELWRTDGWYAFEVYLSNDGHYLVRMGPWSEGREASKEDLAIAFYQDGKLLQEYSTADLLKEKTAVKRTVSHYRWRAPIVISEVGGLDADDPIGPIRLHYDGSIQLRTSEGTIFRFDSKTGKILERKEDPERAHLLERFWRR